MRGRRSCRMMVTTTKIRMYVRFGSGLCSPISLGSPGAVRESPPRPDLRHSKARQGWFGWGSSLFELLVTSVIATCYYATRILERGIRPPQHVFPPANGMTALRTIEPVLSDDEERFMHWLEEGPDDTAEDETARVPHQWIEQKRQVQQLGRVLCTYLPKVREPPNPHNFNEQVHRGIHQKVGEA